MTYDVHITAAAKRDLAHVADYIEYTLENPQAADRLWTETEVKLGSLSKCPDRFALADDPLLASWGIRFTQVRNYLAFYVISEELHLVIIVRFLHGKSSWNTILKDGFSLI